MPSPFAVLADSPTRRRQRRIERLQALEATAAEINLAHETTTSSAASSTTAASLVHRQRHEASTSASVSPNLSLAIPSRVYEDGEEEGEEEYEEEGVVLLDDHHAQQAWVDPTPADERRQQLFDRPSTRHSSSSPIPGVRVHQAGSSSLGMPKQQLPQQRQYPAASSTPGAARGHRRPVPGAPVPAPAPATVPGNPDDENFIESVMLAYDSVMQWTENTFNDDLRRERIEHAERTIPVRSAFKIWRSAIAQHRERARKFKEANAQGVQTFQMMYQVRPFYLLWKVKQEEARTMRNAVGRMMNSERRGALMAWKEFAGEENEMRERARKALAWISPHRRAMRKGLYSWVEYTAEAMETRSREQAAVVAMSTHYKALRAALTTWVAMIAARTERERKVNLCLSHTSPEKRDMTLGFEHLQCRAPTWVRGAHHTHISKNGFGLAHMRDRKRDAAVGSPRLREGDLYTFAFAVFGGGAGVIVGVSDANFMSAETEEQLGGAWGINLSHGALYTKRAFSDRGELHSQQILPLPSIDRARAYSIDNLIEIEVEVDLRKKPYRLAFGLPDEPMVHAATAEINCDAVRPWAYLWGDADAIVLLPRRRPRASRMQTWKHAIRPSLSFRPGQGTGAFKESSAAELAAARLFGGGGGGGEHGGGSGSASAAVTNMQANLGDLVKKNRQAAAAGGGSSGGGAAAAAAGGGGGAGGGNTTNGDGGGGGDGTGDGGDAEAEAHAEGHAGAHGAAHEAAMAAMAVPLTASAKRAERVRSEAISRKHAAAQVRRGSFSANPRQMAAAAAAAASAASPSSPGARGGGGGVIATPLTRASLAMAISNSPGGASRFTQSVRSNATSSVVIAQKTGQLILVPPKILGRARIVPRHTKPEGYTYYADPKRKKPEEHRQERETAVYDFSMRYHDEVRQFGSPDGKKPPTRHPWDRTRPITKTYSDFWRAQV